MKISIDLSKTKSTMDKEKLLAPFYLFVASFELVNYEMYFFKILLLNQIIINIRI